MASQFDGGNNYRQETAAATFDPRTMPAPGTRSRKPAAKRTAAARPLREIPANADWAGIVPPESKKKLVTGAVAAKEVSTQGR